MSAKTNAGDVHQMHGLIGNGGALGVFCSNIGAYVDC